MKRFWNWIQSSWIPFKATTAFAGPLGGRTPGAIDDGLEDADGASVDGASGGRRPAKRGRRRTPRKAAQPLAPHEVAAGRARFFAENFPIANSHEAEFGTGEHLPAIAAVKRLSTSWAGLSRSEQRAWAHIALRGKNSPNSNGVDHTSVDLLEAWPSDPALLKPQRDAEHRQTRVRAGAFGVTPLTLFVDQQLQSEKKELNLHPNPSQGIDARATDTSSPVQESASVEATAELEEGFGRNLMQMDHKVYELSRQYYELPPEEKKVLEQKVDIVQRLAMMDFDAAYREFNLKHHKAIPEDNGRIDTPKFSEKVLGYTYPGRRRRE